jgi:hypothetical protein
MAYLSMKTISLSSSIIVPEKKRYNINAQHTTKWTGRIPLEG